MFGPISQDSLIPSTHPHLWVSLPHIVHHFRPLKTSITFYYSGSPFQREEAWFSQFMILLASKVLFMVQLADLLEAQAYIIPARVRAALYKAMRQKTIRRGINWPSRTLAKILLQVVKGWLDDSIIRWIPRSLNKWAQKNIDGFAHLEECLQYEGTGDVHMHTHTHTCIYMHTYKFTSYIYIILKLE